MKEKQKVAATAGGAVGISALASFVSLCCVGPWAVGFLGITGAVAMARWQPYRPYLLIAAALMLAWGFWRVYRPARYCNAGGCPSRRSIWLQVLLWTAAALLVVSLFADQIQWLVFDPTPEAVRK